MPTIIAYVAIGIRSIRVDYSVRVAICAGPTEDINGLSSAETVGVIVGIASIATILVLVVLIGLMACKYYFFKRSRRRADQFQSTSGLGTYLMKNETDGVGFPLGSMGSRRSRGSSFSDSRPGVS